MLPKNLIRAAIFQTFILEVPVSNLNKDTGFTDGILAVSLLALANISTELPPEYKSDKLHMSQSSLLLERPRDRQNGCSFR